MRALVVEDDHKLNGLLCRYLAEHGYATDGVFDGGAGLTAGQTSVYDVIVLDVMLPELDGMAVCRALRRARVNTPVLMLTARDSIDDRVSGLDCGADDYLTKPFAIRELGARVRALCRRQSGGGAEIIIADLIINTANHEVHRAGSLIGLTPKEYTILEYLARNTGRIVTRVMLEEYAWSYESPPNSNLVDVYIGMLRRKLDDGFEPKLLETVRGFGYRLHAPAEALL